MKLLVTGKSGQVATALQERGAAMGVEIVTLARPEFDLTGAPATITEQVVAAGAGVDAVVNAAAYTAVDKAEEELEAAMAANGAAAGAVADGAARLGVPVVHLSTDYVFNGRKDGPWEEDDETDPLNAYGRSKLAGEEAVRAATPNHAILRTAWVYSPFGKNFVKTMLRLAGDGREELTIVADQIGSPTSALDIADAVLTIARTLSERPDDETLRGVFHLAGSGSTSWAGFAEAIFDGAARRGMTPVPRVKPIPTEAYPTPAARPGNSVLSLAKLQARYGITMRNWQDALDIVLDREIGPA